MSAQQSQTQHEDTPSLEAAAGSLEAAAEATVACTTCKERFHLDDVVPNGYHLGLVTSHRCKVCNSTKTRVRRTLKEHPSIEAESDRAAITIDKEKVIADCRLLYGADMLAQMRSSYTATSEESTNVEMVGTGMMLDLADLSHKYMDKPQRLAAILKNTKTFYCRISETLLYEDMEYKTITTSSASTKRTNEVTVDLNPAKIKKAKAPKDPAAPQPAAASQKAESPDEPPKKPLTEKQKVALGKHVLDLAKHADKLAEVVEPLEKPDENDWVAHVPLYVLNKSRLALAQKEAVTSSLELAMANSDGVMKDLIKSANDCKTELKEMHRKGLVQCEEAKNV